MAITQFPAVKALPYVLSNVMALFTVLPLAVAVICFANAFKGLIDNRMLVEVGVISYEIYLVHAFSLGIVNESVLRILVFVVLTAFLAIGLRLMLSKKWRRQGEKGNLV